MTWITIECPVWIWTKDRGKDCKECPVWQCMLLGSICYRGFRMRALSYWLTFWLLEHTLNKALKCIAVVLVQGIKLVGQRLLQPTEVVQRCWMALVSVTIVTMDCSNLIVPFQRGHEPGMEWSVALTGLRRTQVATSLWQLYRKNYNSSWNVIDMLFTWVVSGLVLDWPGWLSCEVPVGLEQLDINCLAS